MKKLLASLLALMLIIACAAPALAAEGAEPDWTGYDELIAKIKASTDFVEREALMHQAEDMLMDTGCIVPIYYYNDVYMQKPGVEGVYSNAYGTKYFMHVRARQAGSRAEQLRGRRVPGGQLLRRPVHL